VRARKQSDASPGGGSAATTPSFAAVPWWSRGGARAIYVDNSSRKTDHRRDISCSRCSRPTHSRDGKRLLYESLQGALDTVRTTQDQFDAEREAHGARGDGGQDRPRNQEPLTAIGGFARRIASPSGEDASGRAVRRIILKESNG